MLSTISGKDALDKIDEMAFTKDEKSRRQLEWLKNLPTGFQIAQRFIGISFSMVFLAMVTTTFTLMVFGYDVTDLKEYVSETMQRPISIIFALFFGGGLVNSFKIFKKPDPVEIKTSDGVVTKISDTVLNMSNREFRKAKRLQKQQK